MIQSGWMQAEVNRRRAPLAYEVLSGSYRGFSEPLSKGSVEDGRGRKGCFLRLNAEMI